MKIVANSSPNIASKGMTISEMGVSQKRIQKILGYMRDNVYSDKVLAVVREYACNSADEHKKFKIERPVEIGLRKNENQLEYFARDYAKGLSDSGIREIFAMSGESTKDDSDEEIGGFGIGAKCALSYNTKTFFVHSYFEGTKRTYCFALGANEDGQECGSVYGMGEEPTAETGLEVVVPVANGDEADFTNKIRNFVRCSPYHIKADILGVEIAPAASTFEKKVSDYNFRLIECEYQHAQKILFQMGGNTYQIDSFIGPNGEKIKKNHCLIVDIPIGHCSITLSREAFEKTEKNSRVFEEIEGILNALVDEDLAQFKTKNTLELVDDSLAQMKSYAGNMFQASASQIYKNIWGFVSSVSKANEAFPIQDKSGKPICVVIPNNDARNYWKQKVSGFLNDVQQNMYIITEGFEWKQDNPEITNYFSLVSARKLPYPKTKKDAGRFTVYRRFSRRGRVESVGKFNALEFFNHVSNENQWNFEAKTEKEATDFLAKKEKEIKSLSDLELMVVKPNKDNGCSFWGVNSTVFFEKLESLGFIGLYSQKYKDICSKIREREEKRNKIASTISNAKKHWIVYSPKTSKAIERVEKAEKINQFWNIVLKENTLRGKILRKFQDRSYGDSTKLERHELRKILKLV